MKHSVHAMALAGVVLMLGAAIPAAAGGTKVPVPVQVIYPGHAISAGDLRMKAFRTSYVLRRGPVREAATLTGKVARRTLLPGKPIMANAVRAAYQVEKGRPVRVVFAAGGLTITALATALASGSTGDLIQLRNIDSGRKLAGIVQADGSVLIGGQ